MSRFIPQRVGLFIGVSVACLFGIATSASATSVVSFDEVNCPLGDAGNLVSAPCILTGGPYNLISGTIDAAGKTDEDDFFAFHWIQTGDFKAEVTVGDALTLVFLELYSYPSGVSLAAGGSTVAVSALAAGDYVLHAHAVVDPPYSIEIFDLTPGGPVLPISGITAITAAVPEPATLVLLGTGLIAIARRRRTTRARR